MATLDLKEAAQQYVAQFERASGNGAGVAPAWLKDRRQGAITRFAETGFPTTRQEEWRFTDVKPIVRGAFALAPAPAPDAVARDAIAPTLLGEQPWTAVFVNGHYSARLSSTANLPDKVVLGSLNEALERHGDLVREHLAQHARDERNPFTALNTAFVHDGAFVYVPRDVVLDRPLQLVHVGCPDPSQALVWHPRNLVVVERGGQASVLEQYVTVGDGTGWTNAVTEVVVGENAHVDTYRVQDEGVEGFHTATTHSYQARSSVYSCITFALGARLTRHDLSAVLDGEGAEATLDGLTLVTGRQHVDHHTTLEHAKPHCNSWEFFNGVFDDRSRGVFNGRIIVRKGAQQTDSKQTNNNLLLSKRARADSQPQLEIYADDVKCTHGATLGPIDEQQIYYLRTRGLTPRDARALLTYGFAAEILSNVTLDALRQRLDRTVRTRLLEAVGSAAPEG